MKTLTKFVKGRTYIVSSKGGVKMDIIPEFAKQGFLEEYKCVYSGFEKDLDNIIEKDKKIDFFKQEFYGSHFGCFNSKKNPNCFLGLESDVRGLKITWRDNSGEKQEKLINYKVLIDWIEEEKEDIKTIKYEQLSFI